MLKMLLYMARIWPAWLSVKTVAEILSDEGLNMQELCHRVLPFAIDAPLVWAL